MCPRVGFQFTTIGKRFPTVCTSIRLLAPVASFVSVQGGLPGEYLAADGASEVFIIAMCQKVSLKLRLLRKRLVRSVTSLPATIVPIALGSIHGGHMAGDEMLLEST